MVYGKIDLNIIMVNTAMATATVTATVTGMGTAMAMAMGTVTVRMKGCNILYQKFHEKLDNLY